MANSVEQVNRNRRGKDKNKREMHTNSLKNLKPRWKKGLSVDEQLNSSGNKDAEEADVSKFKERFSFGMESKARQKRDGNERVLRIFSL